jgi:hypothetical protein
MSPPRTRSSIWFEEKGRELNSLPDETPRPFEKYNTVSTGRNLRERALTIDDL